MSTTPSAERDERTVAVENAGHRWGLILVSYGLLIDVVYRGIVRHEAAWDLLALAFVGGAVVMVYQARQRTLSRRWVKEALLIVLLGAVFGLITLGIALLIKAK